MHPDHGWKKTKRRGQPVPRPPGTPLPCANPTKCPKSNDGQPHPEKELTGQGWQAYRQYLQIKGGAPCPDDAIVHWYCGVFRLAEDICERAARANMMNPLLTALMAKAK